MTGWGLSADGFAQVRGSSSTRFKRAKVAVRVGKLSVPQLRSAMLNCDGLQQGTRGHQAGGTSGSRRRCCFFRARPAVLAALLRGAQGLDFLTVQFYGATRGKPSAANCSPQRAVMSSLRAAATSLDRSRFVWLHLHTGSNLTCLAISTRHAGDRAWHR
jgi:hypothetical protein